MIFDEAHTMENVASRHIGLSVSSGQMRYALQRLWNPRTEKGLLATLRQRRRRQAGRDLLSESDEFFAEVENACEELDPQREIAERRGEPSKAGAPGRNCASAAPIWCRTTSRCPSSACAKRQRADQDERRQGHGAGIDGMQSAAG